MATLLDDKKSARPEMTLPRSVDVDDDPLAEQISQEIERDIIFSRLTPGRKLPEEELLQRFGASRHQVQEALAQLTRIGIVIKERNKGVTVRRFSADEVRQIYEIREVLQRQAALRFRFRSRVRAWICWSPFIAITSGLSNAATDAASTRVTTAFTPSRFDCAETTCWAGW
jgi:DNA-binding transcriptional regulator YhcF (GntR family)